MLLDKETKIQIWYGNSVSEKFDINHLYNLEAGGPQFESRCRIKSSHKWAERLKAALAGAGVDNVSPCVDNFLKPLIPECPLSSF